eukprot:gb/GEZJ01008966.1/.p3 GENE.gb/GEZJ01008966.1/~~gb/GEZJ01008966.1/.p3  ORF type:complete len:110 (+),score=6.46 gb/GEZJ01008966.1/:39-368(+)
MGAMQQNSQRDGGGDAAWRASSEQRDWAARGAREWSGRRIDGSEQCAAPTPRSDWSECSVVCRAARTGRHLSSHRGTSIPGLANGRSARGHVCLVRYMPPSRFRQLRAP